MRRCRRSGCGIWAVAFAAGLLVACFCHTQTMVAILAAAVLVLGIAYLRS
ncbi:MAG TPA: hypothetical protein H9668_07775 [Firmicutes bacterium]|nr:hypothetical protein [Bacillota bacterium]